MPNVRIDIEYDGTNFCGWQEQPGLRSIQRSLHQALEIVLRQKIRVVYSSGRTDAGVHARRQTCNFFVDQAPDLRRMSIGVTSLLRGEVSILEAEIVPDTFNARHSAIRKQYHYIILNRTAMPTIDRGRVWHFPLKLDLELMQREALSLVGKHDFKSFQAVGCRSRITEKDIYQSELIKEGDYLHYRIVGKAFMKQMVRIIVGSLVEFGKGKAECSSMLDLISRKDRTKAGETAPAQGLYLDWVEYKRLD